MVTPEQLELLMQRALSEASSAADEGEVPIGAVIAQGETVIASDHNRTRALRDPTAHAEVLAIRSAANSLNNWRLPNTIICVTAEPCVMCIGSILLARIPLLVFGTDEPRFGAAGSLFDLTLSPPFISKLRTIRGIRAQECRDLLKSFFALQRQR